MVFAINNMIG